MNFQRTSVHGSKASTNARPAPTVYQPCPAREVVQARMAMSQGRPAPIVYQPCPAREVVQARMATAPTLPTVCHSQPGSAQDFPPPTGASDIAQERIPQMKRRSNSGVELSPAAQAFRPQAGVNGANLPLQRTRLHGILTVQPPRHRVQSLPIQRYTEYTGKEFGGSGKLSENENYFIRESNPKRIFATTQPRNSTALEATTTKGTRSYKLYKSELFFKDCLHTAEEIINEGKLEDIFGKPGSGDFSKVETTGKKFGVGDKENIKAAKKHSLGDAAKPGLGQAYVIVNTEWPKGGARSPYHAAAVVAVDGNDRITLEVFADTNDGTARNQEGMYGMYTAGGSGDTFHTHWQTEYFGNSSLTTVIEQY